MAVTKPTIGQANWGPIVNAALDALDADIADKADSSAVAGKLTAASNLSDVANAATARTNLSLGNVTNTSDASKPVSTAQQAALDLKIAKGELVYNVKDYGVATAGSASANSTAFAAANTAAVAAGAWLHIPAGTYTANTLSLSVPLYGVGKASVINAQTITVNASNVTVSNLKINSRSSTAISVANVDDLSLRDVEVTHEGAVTGHLGADIYNVSRLSVTGCRFHIGGLQLSLSEDFLIQGNTWDCEYLNVNEPMHISGQSYGVVEGNNIYQTLTDGIDLYSSGHYCVVANNRFMGLKGAAGIECKVTMSDDVNNTSSPGNVLDGTIIANNVLRGFISATTSTRMGIYAEYIDNRAAPVFAIAETNRAISITGNIIEDMNEATPGGAIIGSYWGIAYTGHNGLIANNIIRNARTWNASTNIGIKIAEPTGSKAVGVRVAGNVIAGIEGANGAGIEVGNLDRCQIDGNIVRGDEVNATQTKFGVTVVSGATLNHCSISDNLFECNNATGMGIRSGGTTTTFNRCKVQNNILKDCGVSIYVAHYTLFTGNSMDNATNSQAFNVGLASTSCRGNVFSSNHITMSSDYALVLTDLDGFVVEGNTFNSTARAVLLVGNTKNGNVANNVSIGQASGAEFPHYSGVSVADQRTIRVGANNVDGAVAAPDSYVDPNRLTAGQIVPSRDLVTSNVVAVTSGTLSLNYFTADKTELVTNLTCYTGTTAAGATPTLVRMGLYEIAANGDGTLVASTPNDTTLLAAANTAYLKALSVSYTKTVWKRYAVALLYVTAAASPNFTGSFPLATTPVATLLGIAPVLCERLTAQTDLPSTFTAGSLVGYQLRPAILMT